VIRNHDLRRKDVHVKMSRETHMAFKMRLLEHDVSMQRAFEAFAEAVAAGGMSAVNIIVRDGRRRLKEELLSVGIKPINENRRLKTRGPINELDVDAMYDLISDDEDDQESPADEEDPPVARGHRHNEAA